MCFSPKNVLSCTFHSSHYPQGIYQCCGSGIRCLFDPRDPGWVENQDPDPGFGMNIPDHISKCLEQFFWVNFDADADPGIMLTLDPGSGMENIRIRDKEEVRRAYVVIISQTSVVLKACNFKDLTLYGKPY
jgi:hypothetical protein